MPSPIGHLIAGASIGYAFAPRRPGIVALCAAVATSPDLDLLVPGTHRMVTHSIGAVILVSIVAIVVTEQVTMTGTDAGARHGAWHQPWHGAWHRGLAFAIALAYTSHLLLDWLAADPTPPQGIQLLWPFSDAWYISGLDLFRGTARRNLLTPAAIAINAKAIAQEIAILGPVAWIVFRLRK